MRTAADGLAPAPPSPRDAAPGAPPGPPGAGGVAALPLAAAASLLAARGLPVRFAYREDDLGIASLASQLRYPVQQETFWALFAILGGSLAAWLLARVLAAGRPGATALLASEMLAALGLLGLLALPSPYDITWALACGAGALLAAHRPRRPSGAARSAVGPAPAAAPGGDERGRAAPSARLRPLGWRVACATALLALAFTPTLPLGAWNVAHAVPDEQRAVAGFAFEGEIGQHLAWANAILRGGFQGRDFFSLYGPLYDLGLVGAWRLWGRSIAAWDLQAGLARWLSLWGLLLLGASLLERRVLILALPCLVPWVHPRLGLPLFALLSLSIWLRGGRPAWCGVAGLLAGASLLYGQEFGLALVVTAAAALGLRRAGRAALFFGAGALLAPAPLLAWFAANDALLPMLRDLVAYPRYVLAGFGNKPYPALLASLPLDAGRWRALFELRLGYALPAVLVSAGLLALPVSRVELRRPLAGLRERLAALRGDGWRLAVLLVALFGLLAFRSALGRSDAHHLLPALPAAALLACVAFDRLLADGRGGPAGRALAVWRAAALAAFLLLGGFVEAARPLATLARSFQNLTALGRAPVFAPGSPQLVGVTRWIRRNSRPGDALLALPNNAAYYYLADRRNAIRFVMGHQLVTSEHRAEALRELRADPPPLLVWDRAALRVDGLSDELVFGRELLAWLDARYEKEAEIGSVELRRLRPMTSGP